MKTLEELEASLQYTFKQPALLARALTHRSFANESPDETKDNQRLELLGDAVLGLIVTEYLFARYPTYDEGALSKMKAQLVCERTLATIARELDIGEHLLLGRGEAASGGRCKPSLLADAFEALVAAFYLDGGLEAAHGFIYRSHARAFDEVTSPINPQNAKSLLQEMVQDGSGIRPEYTIADVDGPPHQRTFTAHVKVGARVVGRGVGRSKKEAQRNAAAEALVQLRSEVSSTNSNGGLRACD